MIKYNSENVLFAAKERIKFIFDNYEKIIVSISGGKDSTVLAHLTLQEAHDRDRKICLFFLDEEVVYQSTIDQIEYLMNLFPNNTTPLWLQMEFNLTNATSLNQSQLLCWEQGKHDIWMRKRNKCSIKNRMWDKEKEVIRDKNKGFGFYDVIENFERCFSNTAFLIGLRAQESLNRWRSVIKNPVIINDKKIYWATKKKNNCVSIYPIYDWVFNDVWKYIYDSKLKYSKIYDFMYKKGFNTPEMRISSLIHEKAFKSICELPEFEPKTYEKLCGRLKGITFAQETGKNKKMFRIQKLPKKYKTWKEYRDFLLLTYPDKEKKKIFMKRFGKHLNNEYVYRQQVRQLFLNDYENNLPVNNIEDPNEERRKKLIEYYKDVL
jgi:predicted phosphoadenosine phosphosulfate sulfurtransferase